MPPAPESFPFEIMIELNEETLSLLGNGGCGYSAKTLSALGVSWPPKHGWRKAIMGKTISPQNFAAALAGKKPWKGEAKRVAVAKAYITHADLDAAFHSAIARPKTAPNLAPNESGNR